MKSFINFSPDTDVQSDGGEISEQEQSGQPTVSETEKEEQKETTEEEGEEE